MSKRKADSSPPNSKGKKRVKSEVSAIKKAITSKPGWEDKVRNQKVLAKWIQEATAQGARRGVILQAFEELRYQAEGSQGAYSSLFAPTEIEEMEDEDFRAGDEWEDLGGPYRGICYADDLVPTELALSLEKHLDELAALPDKDFHPGSEGMVQDLIHPSMYPYVKGVSLIKQESEYAVENVKRRDMKGDKGSQESESESSEDGKKKRKIVKGKKLKDIDPADYDEDSDGGFDEGEDDEEDEEEEEEKEEEEDNEFMDEWGNEAFFADRHRQYQKSLKDASMTAYQWLPAEFSVDEFGIVSIDSYINNLDREKYSELYEDIAAVFGIFLPFLRKVASLPGRKYQVIVKAANYILKPGEKYEGSWHVEGVPSEHIICSGIYYYHVDPQVNPDACLAFRELRDDGNREGTQNLSFNKNLGKVPTPEGRFLGFANYYQHKVKNVCYIDPEEWEEEQKKKKEKPKRRRGGTGLGWHTPEPPKKEVKEGPDAIRKILCFFVVDPIHKLPSSATVPMQQWDIVRPVVENCLAEVSKAYLKGPLPEEIIKLILSYAKWGFTKEEAEAHRVKLMNNRKFFVDSNNNMWEREYSFCEH